MSDGHRQGSRYLKKELTAAQLSDGRGFFTVNKVKLSAALFLLLLPAGAAAEENYLAVPSAEPGRFLLFDRKDPSQILKKADIDTRTEEAADKAAELPLRGYSTESWNRAREEVDSGSLPVYEPPPDYDTFKTMPEPAKPEPQLRSAETGTSLSITGRKLITVNYSGKRYLNRQTAVTRPKSLSLFEINQQMQVRMHGKVGQKISVNVDYDDTKQDKQDISVVYQGDSRDVVQNVSFGDIDLSIPATEFVSYNKQLFGIRADLRTSRLKATFVGSRTKGQTKTKQFTGNTQFKSVDIPDTSYIRRKYYDIAFSPAGLKAMS